MSKIVDIIEVHRILKGESGQEDLMSPLTTEENVQNFTL